MVSIRWIGSPNYLAGNWPKEGFILHHMAGYLPGTDSLFQSASHGVATHYGVGSRDGKGNGLEVHQYVRDKDRAYGSYNGDADRRGLSIEIENSYPGVGKPTPEVHELVAQLVAQKAREHNMRLPLRLGDFWDHRYYLKVIPEFGPQFQVTTHRSMALKNCPNEVDVQWIVNRANGLLNATAPAGGVGTPIETPIWRQYMASGIGYFCKQADGSVDYALAGNGVGPAAWIPLGSGVAQKVAAVVGSFIELSPSSWVSIKARYEATPEVGSVSATVDLAPLVAAIQALPAASAAELAKRLAG